MKKILMAAALGMLMSAVCMAQNVTVNPGDGQLEVSWDAVEGANGYQLWYGTNPDDLDQRSLDVSGTSGIISSLRNDVQYYVSVYPINAAGDAIAELKGYGIPAPDFTDTDRILADIAATEGKIATLDRNVNGLTQNVNRVAQNVNTVSGKVDAVTELVKRGNTDADRRAADAEKRAQTAENTARAAVAQAQTARQNEAVANARADYADNKLNELLSVEGLPLWVTDSDELNRVLEQARLEGVFVGIGSATNKKDYQAIQMAEARARQDLAFQLDAQIKAEITDYAKNLEGERGEVESVSSASEEYIVAQQSVDTRLRSAEVVKRQKVTGSSPSDPHTWWVVVTTGKPKGNIDINGNIIPPTADPVKTKSPYETLEAPEAVKKMEEHLEAINLKDERMGRNNLKPDVSAALSE